MGAKRYIEAAGATVASALALAASSPNVQAADPFDPNQNPANRLAKQYVKHMGGRLLSIARRAEGDRGISAINPSEAVSFRVIINAGRSAVAGSNGRYVFSAFADKVGNNGLDRSDINSVRVAEGSSPADGRPLFAARMFTPHPHSHAPNEGGARGWYAAEGTAVMPGGNRVDFAGSTDPSPFSTPPGLVLDRGEVRRAGQTMEGIIDDGVARRATHLVKPPFGPLQPEIVPLAAER